MAIDGLVAFVTTGSEHGEQALDLFLVDDTAGSLRGQADLRILRPSGPPPALGARIWGGASTVHIVAPDGAERVYDRVGHTRLVARPDDPWETGARDW